MPPLPYNHEFSALDEMLPPFYYSYLLCFPSSRDTTHFRDAVTLRFQEALDKLAIEAPYLRGSVRRCEPGEGERNGRLVIDNPKSQESAEMQLNICNLGEEKKSKMDSTRSKERIEGRLANITYAQLQEADMPPHELDARILSHCSAGVDPTDRPFSVQVNFITGGVILALQFHHNFVDARGASQIITRLAEFFEKDSRPDTNPQPINGLGEGEERGPLSLSTLRAKHNFSALQDDPTLWRLNCLAPDQTYLPGEPAIQWPAYLPSLLPEMDPPVNGSTFSFTPSSLATLKRLASPESPSSSDWISTHDALAAFLWQRVMRARYPEIAAAADADQDSASGDQEEETSHAVVALDGRKPLSIPDSHLGNVVFHTFTGLPLRTVCRAATPLRVLACAIRGTIQRFRNNPGLLANAAGLAAGLPSVRSLRYAADNLGTDFYVTSWRDLPLYEADWGPLLGRPDFVRIPDNHFQSLTCVFPPRPGSGVVDVVVSMRGEAGRRLRLDGEMSKFATLVGPRDC